MRRGRYRHTLGVHHILIIWNLREVVTTAACLEKLGSVARGRGHAFNQIVAKLFLGRHPFWWIRANHLSDGGEGSVSPVQHMFAVLFGHRGHSVRKGHWGVL